MASSFPADLYLLFLFAKDPPSALTAPTAIYVRVCVLVDLEIASLRRLRALQYSRRYVRFGSVFWPISSLEPGELLILIPYLARPASLAASACLAIRYSMAPPARANFLAIYDS